MSSRRSPLIVTAAVAYVFLAPASAVIAEVSPDDMRSGWATHSAAGTETLLNVPAGMYFVLTDVNAVFRSPLIAGQKVP